jgi:hypothetical protein
MRPCGLAANPSTTKHIVPYDAAAIGPSSN